MPLKYPAEWKFDGFPHAMPEAAHDEFCALVHLMAEGVPQPQGVYEDYRIDGFKNGDIILEDVWIVDKNFGQINHAYVSTYFSAQGGRQTTRLSCRAHSRSSRLRAARGSSRLSPINGGWNSTAGRPCLPYPEAARIASIADHLRTGNGGREGERAHVRGVYSVLSLTG
jgi:hypothetical protein